MTDTSETTAPERTAPKNNAPIVNEPLIRKSTWTQERPPEDGIGLCLSGGGYRAMLFHIGSLWRLNELGLLAKIDRIASVSGGSITAATLGLAWKHLEWDANRERITQASLEKYFVAPLRAFARKTIDLTAIGWGIFSPFSTIGEQIAAAYDDALFHGATLQDLPDDWSKATPRTGGPRFVIVATNVRTGSLCRFAKPYLADYRVGLAREPRIPLAAAVAASAAFPPFLSPMRIDLSELTFEPDIPNGHVSPDLRQQAILTDGGVYDNLGIEPIWKRYKTVFVSDAGRRMLDELHPASDWALHSRRLIDLLQSQISSLRRSQVIDSYAKKDRQGAYWGIQTSTEGLHAPDILRFCKKNAEEVAGIDTRLAALPERDQERLINWGYAIADASIRSFYEPCTTAPPPQDYPYPQTGI